MKPTISYFNLLTRLFGKVYHKKYVENLLHEQATLSKVNESYVSIVGNKDTIISSLESAKADLEIEVSNLKFEIKEYANYNEALQNLKDSKNNEISELNKTINYLNAKISELEQYGVDNALLKTKLEYHNDLLEEHSKLRKLYEELNARFRDAVTLSKNKKKEEVNEDPLADIPVVVKDKVIRMIKQRNSYDRIMNSTKLSKDTILLIKQTMK